MHEHSHFRGPRRRRKREKGPEKIFEEIIPEKFPNMGKEIVNQVQGAQRFPAGQTQGGTHQDTVIKLTKIKRDKILKATREK